jgi:acetoacetyl-CoA synthetase
VNAICRATDADAARASQLEAFRARLVARFGTEFPTYAELHRWACDHSDEFWCEFLAECRFDTAGSDRPASIGDGVENRRFFPQLRLNYAQILLRSSTAMPDDTACVVERRESGARSVATRAQLRDAALRVAATLENAGIVQGQVAVAIASNSINSVAACLGATSLGAVWSAVAPDLGADAVIARFGQLAPVVLFADLAYTQHGVTRSLAERVAAIVTAIPTIRHVIVLGATTESLERLTERVSVVCWHEVQGAAPICIVFLGDHRRAEVHHARRRRHAARAC